MSVEQMLAFSKKRENIQENKQTGEQNNSAGHHGKCCCLENKNASVLSRRLFMFCVEVITLGDMFHISIQGWMEVTKLLLLRCCSKM